MPRDSIDKFKVHIHTTNKKRNNAQERLIDIDKRIEKIKSEAEKTIVEEQSKKSVFEQVITECDERLEWLTEKLNELNEKVKFRR